MRSVNRETRAEVVARHGRDCRRLELHGQPVLRREVRVDCSEMRTAGATRRELRVRRCRPVIVAAGLSRRPLAGAQHEVAHDRRRGKTAEGQHEEKNQDAAHRSLQYTMRFVASRDHL